MAVRTDVQRTGTWQWKRARDNTWEPAANPHVPMGKAETASAATGNLNGNIREGWYQWSGALSRGWVTHDFTDDLVNAYRVGGLVTVNGQINGAAATEEKFLDLWYEEGDDTGWMMPCFLGYGWATSMSGTPFRIYTDSYIPGKTGTTDPVYGNRVYTGLGIMGSAAKTAGWLDFSITFQTKAAWPGGA